MKHSKELGFLFFFIVFLFRNVYSQGIPNSSQTEECLACHSVIHPGIVESWNKSRHSAISPIEALKGDPLERRISSSGIDASLLNVTVGCYECHSLNTEKHQDSFEHNGYKLNVIVSSNDCAECHSDEFEQYAGNMMSHAYSNLTGNPVYSELMRSVNNPYVFSEKILLRGENNRLTDQESCLYCHGSKIEVNGFVQKDTDYGSLSFPVITGWPNQGVGRLNPDGSIGSCTSCHPRHDFSIATARKPYTCSECHKGPDVPAYKVYEVSKHGNMFYSGSTEYSFNNVPWQVGKDFTAPTCAACHASLLVSEDVIIAERTHKYNDRLSYRLFGVPYAHPHPINADLKDVINSQGLPLIVELTGEPVEKFVITAEEQKVRNIKMKKICLGCHSSGWVDNHFERLENTIKTTNAQTLEATKILSEIWQNGIIEGLPQGKSIFDDEIERNWTSIWLIHENSARFTSAMAGGGDYGVFADGRYQSTEQLFKLLESLKENKTDK